MILLKKHYLYSTPTRITSAVTDKIRYSFKQLMKGDEMWILFIVKISCHLIPVNLDQLSRKIATLANALMMDKQLTVL